GRSLEHIRPTTLPMRGGSVCGRLFSTQTCRHCSWIHASDLPPRRAHTELRHKSRCIAFEGMGNLAHCARLHASPAGVSNATAPDDEISPRSRVPPMALPCG